MGAGRLNVLIVGAGIGGSALATLLGRCGHVVTVVERDQGTRSSGNPVDVRGTAYGVVSELGLVQQLRELATSVRRVSFIDATGRRRAGLSAQRTPHRALEVARADLSTVLTRAAQEVSEVRFDDTITSVSTSSSQVAVSFDRAKAARFDVVIGADGVRSTVRRMVFGPNEAYLTALGMYVATVQLGPEWQLSDPTTVLVHNEAGTSTSLHPGSGRPIAAFIFRSPVTIDPRNRQQADQLMRRTYAGSGWRDSELLEAYFVASDTYFDQVSRVRVHKWFKDRVVLLGDAASSTSLFGEGSSNAIVGAARLAHVLSSIARPEAAFARYEREHRRTVSHGQRLVPLMSHLLVPNTASGIKFRNRLLSHG